MRSGVALPSAILKSGSNHKNEPKHIKEHFLIVSWRMNLWAEYLRDIWGLAIEESTTSLIKLTWKEEESPADDEESLKQ